MAWLYVSGIVFAILAAFIIAHELWLLATGRLDDAQLVAVAESDDMPHGNPEDGTLKYNPPPAQNPNTKK